MGDEIFAFPKAVNERTLALRRPGTRRCSAIDQWLKRR
jgi:hypothetical protein